MNLHLRYISSFLFADFAPFSRNFVIFAPKIVFQFHQKESMLASTQLQPFSPIQSWLDWVWRSCYAFLPLAA